MRGPLSLYEGLMARLDGPLHFRFFAQPAMAAFLAIRDGIKDAREDKPAYFWGVLSGVGNRGHLLRSGLKSVAKVIVLAVVLDIIYQLIEFRTIHIVGLLGAALVLAVIPYLLLRGPAKRIARWGEPASPASSRIYVRPTGASKKIRG